MSAFDPKQTFPQTASRPTPPTTRSASRTPIFRHRQGLLVGAGVLVQLGLCDTRGSLNALFKVRSCDTVFHDSPRGDKGKLWRVGLMCLKVLSVASATLLLSLVSIHGASAEGGCGPGFHRGPYGHCRPNGPVVVAPAAPVVVAPAVVAPAPVVCGVGYRWHPYRRRCVVL